MPANHTLVLIDYHPLVPFIVRSHQFVSRAAGFAKSAPNNLDVQLWLPDPRLGNHKISQQIGLEITEQLIRFGPVRSRRILGKNVTLTFLFRKWVKKQLQQLSKTARPIVYFRTLKLADALLPHLQKLGIPYIFETHEIFHRTGKNPERIRSIEERVYNNAAIVVSISKSLSEDLHDEFGLRDTILMPSGHNGSLEDIPDYDAEAPPRFLYIGSLHRWKGIEPFLMATKELKIHTDIVGDAGGLERLRQFVNDNALKHVVLHGQKRPDELKSFYNEGTICILPLSDADIAQRYTSPLKLFEYTSAGRPVMIGRAPTITSIPGIQSAVCLVDGDWNSAAEALLSNAKERQLLSETAREFAISYTWTELAKNLLDNPDFRKFLCR
jgi:glycosyltransferase involved in cell wall biosynthesis